MHLVSNSANGRYLGEIIANLAKPQLQRIRAAVAYTRWIDPLVKLADETKVPFALFTLADGDFPAPAVVERFLNRPAGWDLRLTRDFFHAKVIWLEGLGAYVGSANLTEKAWWQNIECGVWFTQDDLLGEPLELELATFFRALEDGGRFVRAKREHLDELRRLAAQSKKLADARADLARQADLALAGIPGTTAPAAVLGKDRGDRARQAFITEWDNTLTLLRKLTEKAKTVTWPAWVDPAQAASIVQDQATEYWWHHHCRRSAEGSSETMMEIYRARNERHPDAAVDQLFAEWSTFEGDSEWFTFLNVAPQESRRLLARDAIAALGKPELTKILWNAHAAREHARQILKSELGDEGRESSRDERCALFANCLLAQRTSTGRGIRDVLDFVLWGDAADRSVASRIYTAATDPAWKLRHLGLSILGELVGYARPDEYPPRNTRVSKTLTALGFSGIRI